MHDMSIVFAGGGRNESDDLQAARKTFHDPCAEEDPRASGIMRHAPISSSGILR
jgi:hypothetical protein